MRPIHDTWLPVLIDPIRLAVLGVLHERETASVRDLATMAHTSNRTLRRHLDILISLGMVHEVEAERDGVKPGRPATRFLLDPRVRKSLGELFAILCEPLEA